MTVHEENEGYGSFAKTLHWLVAAILLAQFALGWLMPKVRRGMEPSVSMRVHISVGIVVLALIVVRLLWRMGHGVPPEPQLPRWQRTGSVAVHWLLYGLVFVTTLTGWFYASARGWPLTFFGLFPLPALSVEGSPTGRALGEIHESLVWVLLAVIAVHVLAALVHAFVYRDHVMQRMLFVTPPGRLFRR
jgi:cytochrome b561